MASRQRCRGRPAASTYLYLVLLAQPLVCGKKPKRILGILAAAKRRPAATFGNLDNELQQIGGASCGLRGHIVAGPILLFSPQGSLPCTATGSITDWCCRIALPTSSTRTTTCPPQPDASSPSGTQFICRAPCGRRQTADVAHRERVPQRGHLPKKRPSGSKGS